MAKTKGFFSKLFKRDSSGKTIPGASSENVSTETKKCLRCLRRVSIDFEICPHCRSVDFMYNEA